MAGNYNITYNAHENNPFQNKSKEQIYEQLTSGSFKPSSLNFYSGKETDAPSGEPFQKKTASDYFRMMSGNVGGQRMVKQEKPVATYAKSSQPFSADEYLINERDKAIKKINDVLYSPSKSDAQKQTRLKRASVLNAIADTMGAIGNMVAVSGGAPSRVIDGKQTKALASEAGSIDDINEKKDRASQLFMLKERLSSLDKEMARRSKQAIAQAAQNFELNKIGLKSQLEAEEKNRDRKFEALMADVQHKQNIERDAIKGSADNAFKKDRMIFHNMLENKYEVDIPIYYGDTTFYIPSKRINNDAVIADLYATAWNDYIEAYGKEPVVGDGINQPSKADRLKFIMEHKNDFPNLMSSMAKLATRTERDKKIQQANKFVPMSAENVNEVMYNLGRNGINRSNYVETGPANDRTGGSKDSKQGVSVVSKEEPSYDKDALEDFKNKFARKK